MLDPSLKNLLIETISACLKPTEAAEIGRMLSKKFDLHSLADKTVNMTIGARPAASILVEHMEHTGKTAELIKLLAELDNNLILGKTLQLEGYDYFLQQFTQSGFFYDFKKRKVLPIKSDSSELPNWGSLKDGKTYPVTILSVDIVGNSELVKTNGTKTMKKVYTNLWNFLKQHLAHTDGRIWSWAGDGGILAFAYKDQVERAVRFAIEVQRTIPLFNMSKANPIINHIELRIGIHTGKVTYHSDSGQIISEVINLAAHLEKQKTVPGSISITEEVFNGINPKLQGIFAGIGVFEGTTCFQCQRLDQITC